LILSDARSSSQSLIPFIVTVVIPIVAEINAVRIVILSGVNRSPVNPILPSLLLIFGGA